MAEKQLIIVVDGTVEMRPHWQTIFTDYLEKIVRSFCRNESTSQDSSIVPFQLGLIIYGAHGPYNDCLVKSSGWTKEVDRFLQWLRHLSFGGGNFGEAGILKGLSDALMMFSAKPNGNQIQQFGQRHCILVASCSNPIISPKLRQLQKFQNLDSDEISDARFACRLADMETVARSFIQCFISLSVISPKQLPWLEAIYNAANYNHQAAESSNSDIKNPDYLVLLSQYFADARAALNQHELKCKLIREGLLELELEKGLISPNPDNFSDEDAMMLQQVFHEPLTSQQENLAGNIPKLPNEENENIDGDEDVVIFREILDELATSEHEISAVNIPSATSLLKKGKQKLEDDDDVMMLWESLSESLTSQQQFSTKDFPTAVEKELDAVKSEDPVAAFQQCSNVLHSTSNSVRNIQTSSNNLCSQGIFGFDDTKLDITPAGIVLSQKVHPWSVASINASLLSNPPLHQLMTSTATTGIRLPEPQNFGSEYKSPQQTMRSLRVNSEKLLTPPSAQYAANGFIASAASTTSRNLKVSQTEGIQKMSSFTHSFYGTIPETVKSESTAKTPRGSGKNITGLLTSATSNIDGNLKTSQPLENHQGPVSNSQSLPIMTLRHFSRTQMAQDEHSLKRKHFDIFGQSSISCGADTRVPMVGKYQRVQGGLEPFVVTNTLCHKTLSQQATRALPEGPPKGYIKAWEGDLTSKENGLTVFVTRLTAYCKMSTSVMLATNWPSSLHMDQLISQNHINNIPYDGEVDYLIFEAMSHCAELDELGEKRLCAYIKLPPQTLVLSASTTKLRFIGTLYHGDFPVYKHQIYSPQQHQ